MYYYHSHYSDDTFMKRSESSVEAINERSKNLRMRDIRCIDETWIPGYGITAVWRSLYELSQEEMNLLCLKKLPHYEVRLSV